MSFKWVSWKSRDFLVAILFSQLILYVIVFFDVPVARQVIGFLYLTVVPGIVIIKLMKLDELDGLETILVSVGFSIAFLMLAGLSINEICPLFGITKPLSLLPLTIILNSVILTGGVLVYLRNEGAKVWEIKTFRLHPLAICLIGLPFLSLIGTIYVKTYDNNLILLSMMIIISLLFVIMVISKKIPLPKLYPLAVFVIALSLLYHASLVSNYMTSYGSDATRELFIFRTTQENMYWTPVNLPSHVSYGRVNSMLSVTILPTIYSNLLNVDPTWVFKIFYPLIFALVPLGLYKVWKRYLGSKYAFISAFFFMSIETFYFEMLGLNRQIIAELFFVLLLFTIFNNKMKGNNRIICFMVFGLALVGSHYGLAQIFALFIFLALILSIVSKRPARNLTTLMVVFFFVVMFSWYIYTSGSAVFDSFVSYGEYVFNSLGDFFNIAARQPEVLRGLGLESSPTIWNAMGRGFAYTTEFLIVAGFIGLIAKRVIHFDRDFFIFIVIAMLILALLILVPGLARTMNMTRFYHVLLFFLAPLIVIGAEFLVKLMFKRKRELWISTILLIVLIPHFLFQSGFLYEVTESQSWSVPLGKNTMSAIRLRRFLGYVDEREIFGAKWVQKNVDTRNSQIYADIPSNYFVLFPYGMVPLEDVIVLNNVTSVAKNGIVYLDRLNVIEGIIADELHVWNKTEFSFLNDLNKIYSNGGSEIYRK